MSFNPLPIVLSAVGMYFLIRLRFFFLIHPVRTMVKTFRAVKDSRAFRSLTLALAGTLGVGNVFGVALGLIIGGAGSLFWLFVSMIFAAVVKYAEVVICSDNLYHDRDAHGGIYYVIRNSFRRFSSAASVMYSFGVLLLSLFMGAALQSGAVYETVGGTLGSSRGAVAAVLFAVTLALVIGGVRKIEKVTVYIIPLTTIIYIFITLSIVLLNSRELPGVIDEIILSAFDFKSAAGGIIGFLLSSPIREGFARGILSNEAGAGTSSMAHARGGSLNPALAGLVGIFEVWFDTGMICMLTGLSILTSVPDPSAFDGGMELVLYTVGSSFGSLGKYAVLFCVVCFAVATVLCWYYYGLESFSSVFGPRYRYAFLPLFLSFLVFGVYADSARIVAAVDLLMLLITALTLTALMKNSDRIRVLSERGGILDADIRRFSKIKGSVSSRAHRRRGG